MSKARPLISKTKDEARRRALSLYKSWCRQVPFIKIEYDIPATKEMLYDKVREEFVKNKKISDLRVIDMLIFKGQNELQETAYIWKQRTHIMDYFSETVNKVPNDFTNRFMFGK